MRSVVDFVLTVITALFIAAYSLGVFIINLIFVTAPIWVLVLIFA